MAYDLTNNARKVFVRIHHAGGWWPQYYHCIHVDGGCSAVCSRSEPTPPEFFDDLSTIVDQFVQDAFTNTWAPTVINYRPTCTMDIDMIHEGAIQGNHSGSSLGLWRSSKKGRQASFLVAKDPEASAGCFPAGRSGLKDHSMAFLPLQIACVCS